MSYDQVLRQFEVKALGDCCIVHSKNSLSETRCCGMQEKLCWHITFIVVQRIVFSRHLLIAAVKKKRTVTDFSCPLLRQLCDRQVF